MRYRLSPTAGLSAISCLVVFLFCLSAKAQTRREAAFEELIDQLQLEQQADLPYEELLELLYQRYQQPIDLNSDQEEDLLHIPFLSPVQRQRLLEYRRETGPFVAVYELQAVPGIGTEVARQVAPFVTVGLTEADLRPLGQRLREEADHYLLMRYSRRLPRGRGFRAVAGEPPAFAGSPDYLLYRWRLRRTHDFSAGFQLEKDAGEALSFQTSPVAFDQISGHLMLENRGTIKKVLLGDYRIAAGQGLVHGGGFGLGKGTEPLLYLSRGNQGILPHTGALETGYMRGIAATLGRGRWESSFWLSSLLQDAGIDSTESWLSSGIRTSGLHRTATELAGRNALRESQAGTLLNYKAPGFLAGAGFTAHHFNLPLPPGSRPYQRFHFSGKHNHVVHAYLRKTVYNWNLFAEGARSASGGLAWLVGAQVYLHRQLQVGLLLRKYDRDYHSFYGQAFGESSTLRNEQGSYLSLRFLPHRKWELTAYMDRFRFPWLRFGVDAPSEGFDYTVTAQFKPARGQLLRMGYRNEQKQKNFDVGDSQTRLLQMTNWQQLRLQWQQQGSEGLGFKTQVFYNHYSDEEGTGTGWALMQDVQYDKTRWGLSTRLALFQTSSFANRIYSYERDVRYAFSVPFYEGNGLRSYLMLYCKPTQTLKLWLRYARFYYLDRSEVGSGSSSAPGAQQHDLRVQLIYRPWAATR